MKITELKKNLAELTKKFDYFAALMIEDKNISIRSSTALKTVTRNKSYVNFTKAALKLKERPLMRQRTPLASQFADRLKTSQLQEWENGSENDSSNNKSWRSVSQNKSESGSDTRTPKLAKVDSFSNSLADKKPYDQLYSAAQFGTDDKQTFAA